MWSLIVVIITFVLILLVSKKVELGYTLLIGAVLIAVFSGMGWNDFWSSFAGALINKETGSLLCLLFLILLLSHALKLSGQLERLVDVSTKLFSDLRLMVFFMPALIGMLPMPGGAYFSAPMVGQALEKTNFSPEKKAFANYWFRHIWEYILPLYPGIVAVVALTELEFREVVSANIFLTLSACFGGAFIVFFRSGFKKEKYRGSFNSFRRFVREISPIGIVLILAIFFKVYIGFALMLGLAVVFLMNRFDFRSIGTVFKKAFSFRMFMMVMGIVIFKGILSDCGLVQEIAFFMKECHIGALPVIFGISFLSGFVTGITIGFVGISFPIILAIIEEPNKWNIMFAFACGFAGVLLSPVHMCLIMTAQYFKASLGGIYRYIVPAALLIMGVGFAGMWIGGAN